MCAINYHDSHLWIKLFDVLLKKENKVEKNVERWKADEQHSGVLGGGQAK